MARTLVAGLLEDTDTAVVVADAALFSRPVSWWKRRDVGAKHCFAMYEQVIPRAPARLLLDCMPRQSILCARSRCGLGWEHAGGACRDAV